MWHVRDAAELESFTDALTQDQALESVVGRAGEGNFVRGALDHGLKAIGQERRLPEPDETYVENGFSLNGGARAVIGVLSGQVGGEGAEAVGKKVSKNGDTTYYISRKLSGEAGLQAVGVDTSDPVLGGGSVSGELDLVTGLTLDKNGNMKKVETMTTTAGEANGLAAAAFTGEADPDMNHGRGQAVVHRASLPVDTPEKEQIANNYLLMNGMYEVDDWDNPALSSDLSAGLFAQDSELLASHDRFMAAARRDGDVTQQTHKYDSSTPFGYNAYADVGVKLGLKGEMTTTKMEITDARYFNGEEMAPWTGCYSGGTP